MDEHGWNVMSPKKQFIPAPANHSTGRRRQRWRMPCCKCAFAIVFLTVIILGFATRLPPWIVELPWDSRSLSWTLFTRDHVFCTAGYKVIEGLNGTDGLRSDLASVLADAVVTLNRRTHPRRWQYTLADFVEGMYRYVPDAGVSYQLLFRSLSRPSAVERVSVRRPLAAATFAVSTSDGDEPIWLVAGYYDRPSQLRRFLAMFAGLVMRRLQPLGLVLVFFWGGTDARRSNLMQDHYREVGMAVEEINSRCGRRAVRLLSEPSEFSRGRAMLSGAAALHDLAEDALLFLVDVDLVFGPRMLQRCRVNSAPGRRAYFPVPYTTYNPDIFAAANNLTQPYDLTRPPFSRDIGFWITYGFGMSCIYRSDFVALTDSSLNISGWGGEDDLLHGWFVASGVEVIRAPDPDLVHLYHHKTCSTSLSTRQYKSCIGTKMRNEASGTTWAKWAHRLMNSTNPGADMKRVLQDS